MILLKFEFSGETPHETFWSWKFNTSLLKDKQYLDEINVLIDSIIVEYAVFPYARDSINNIPKNEIQFLVSDDTGMDFLLMKIQSKTIAYATMKKKRANLKTIHLEKDIQKLGKSNKSQEDCMNGKKAELKAIREKRVEDSKARGIAHGEKVTSYFCSLEKRHYIGKKYGQAY